MEGSSVIMYAREVLKSIASAERLINRFPNLPDEGYLMGDSIVINGSKPGESIILSCQLLGV